MALTTVSNAGLAGSIDLTAKVTGTLPIANGGTNSTSTTYCDLTANVTGTMPAGNGGTGATTYTPGKILKVQSYSNTADVNTTSSSLATFYTAVFTPTSASSTILFVLAYNYQLYGNSTDNDANGVINITSEATGSSVIITQQQYGTSDVGNSNTMILEQSGCMQGTQASQGTSAFDTTLRYATRATGRMRVFQTDGDAANPIVLTIYEIGA